MNTKKIILSGIAATLIYCVWYWLTLLICGFFNWEFIGIEFVASVLSGLILSIILVLVYAVLYKGIPGQGIKKGLWFGLLVWAVCVLPTAIKGVLIYLALSELVKLLILGAVIAAIYKEPSA